MVRYVEYLRSSSRELLRCGKDYGYFQGYGDWLALDGSGRTDGGTPKELIGTAFFAHSARLLGRIAQVLGKEEDAAKYQRLYEDVRRAFAQKFITPSGLVAGLTQTAYVLALHFDLLDESQRPAATAALVNDIVSRGMHLSTGFVGSPYLPHVLTRQGRLDIAFELLHQKTWPSWLYAVTQGATTIWERWDGWTHDKGFQDPGMNSFNHYAYGSIGEWLYGTVAGIELDPERPGYKHIVLRPRIGGGLNQVKATLQSVHGSITSEWRTDQERLEWRVEIPPNTTATLHVPCADEKQLQEGGRLASVSPGLRFLRRDGETSVWDAVSGRYEFAAPLKPST
jgi:alpha-L-rhamnosidase